MTSSSERTTTGAQSPDGAACTIMDGDAFRVAFEEHAPTIYRYACARVGAAAAEEVLASTFEAAWRARASYIDHALGGVEAWLVGIATVIIRRFRRAERRWLKMCDDTEALHREARPSEEHVGVEDRLDAGIRVRHLAAALLHIPRREREVLLMHVLHELSYEQIAGALAIPVGTVRSRISRARTRLVERTGGSDDT